MAVLYIFLAILGLTAGDGRQVLRGNSSDETKETAKLNSPRYLQRRATTVFFDDFSSGHVDTNKWHLDSTAIGNSADHFQMYVPAHENCYVKNGVLHIKPTYTVNHFGNNFLQNGHLDVRDEWGRCTGLRSNCVAHGWHVSGGGNKIKPIMSSMLRSTGHIRYGKVEVVAQLAVGDWIRSAIWMLPVDNAYGNWPRSGEIDIDETCGNRHYHSKITHLSRGVDVIHSTIHYGESRNQHRRHHDEYILPHSTFGDGFHKYWLDWNENHIIVGVDDHPVFSWNTPPHGYWQEGKFPSNLHNVWASGSKAAPFDKPFYLILDVAVNGGQFSENYVNERYPKPWTLHEPNAMEKFWAARHLWEATWHGEATAMKIRSVKMQQY